MMVFLASLSSMLLSGKAGLVWTELQMHLSIQATLTWNGFKAGFMLLTFVNGKNHFVKWPFGCLHCQRDVDYLLIAKPVCNQPLGNPPQLCNSSLRQLACRQFPLRIMIHVYFKHGDCIPEHVRSGNKAIRSCGIQLLTLQKGIERLLLDWTNLPSYELRPGKVSACIHEYLGRIL